MQNEEKEEKGKKKTTEPMLKKERHHTHRVCSICGHPLQIPAGSCHVCSNCGSTSGCS